MSKSHLSLRATFEEKKIYRKIMKIKVKGAFDKSKRGQMGHIDYMILHFSTKDYPKILDFLYTQFSPGHCFKDGHWYLGCFPRIQIEILHNNRNFSLYYIRDDLTVEQVLNKIYTYLALSD